MRQCVVVPWYRNELAGDEEVSLKHLRHFLGHYDIFLVSPCSLQIQGVEWEAVRFRDEYFQNRSSYSKLLLSHRFYEAFAEYDYILIYQLDCLVFSDDLAAWCEAGYDYIGAPWFVEKNNPTSGFSRVGNGGFSLRRVDSFLKVLDSNIDSLLRFWSQNIGSPPPDVREQYHGRTRIKKHLQVLRSASDGVTAYARQYSLNEDLFWSDRARLFESTFSIAPVEVGLRFAFECAPRYCYSRVDEQLPFGCHAWAEWDRTFWEPFLL